MFVCVPFFRIPGLQGSDGKGKGISRAYNRAKENWIALGGKAVYPVRFCRIPIYDRKSV